MNVTELRLAIAQSLLIKSGAREWESPEVSFKIGLTAIALADLLTNGANDMAVTAVQRAQQGTQKTFKSSGGSSAITLASLANSTSESTGARQSVKLDLGATRAPLYKVNADFELAATPTAGNTIDLYWAPSDNATAGTNNPGNVSGTDASYTGYSSNINASLKQLQFIGSFVCTAQATGTVQKGFVGRFAPSDRYGSLVLFNKSGAAFHSSDTNSVIYFTPIEPTSEPS